MNSRNGGEIPSVVGALGPTGSLDAHLGSEKHGGRRQEQVAVKHGQSSWQQADSFSPQTAIFKTATTQSDILRTSPSGADHQYLPKQKTLFPAKLENR
jgi:hypothetical protein